MRAINKDLNNIPLLLQTDSNSILRDPAKTTYERRLKLISNGEYPAAKCSSAFDNRYKMPDIKELLRKLYQGKCAYCESRVEQMVVEHYRPKRGGYYWLAYSWDNLLCACPKCNEYKGYSFPILSGKVSYDPVRDTMGNIHQLGVYYDQLERPLLINPERITASELDDAIRFDKDGHISSVDLRMCQTIDVCKLDRNALCEGRKKIWDDLRKDILLAVSIAGDNKEELRVRLSQVIRSYVMKSKDKSNEFTAYRNYVLKGSWVHDLIKELIGK